MEKNFVLNDGNRMPKVGFGTYKLNGGQGADAIVSALRLGYRLLDSAFNYENEGAVGRAVARAGIPRDEIFVVSKLPGRHHRYDAALAALQESLYRTGLDRLDLYLIHWPNPLEDRYVEAWRALVRARELGLVRSVGVSNFLPEHIGRLEKETGVLPAVNQIELHPYFSQEPLRRFCAEKGIAVQAWSPLGRGNASLREPVVEEIARRHGRTATQVILRWELELGVGVIPKASSPAHQAENLALFDFGLSREEVAAISALTRADGRSRDRDPAVHQEF